MRAGVALASCHFGFECKQRDLIVAVTCLQNSVCVDDRFALAQIYAQEEGYDFGIVMAAYDRAVEAIHQKDARPFLKPI